MKKNFIGVFLIILSLFLISCKGNKNKISDGTVLAKIPQENFLELFENKLWKIEEDDFDVDNVPNFDARALVRFIFDEDGAKMVVREFDGEDYVKKLYNVSVSDIDENAKSFVLNFEDGRAIEIRKTITNGGSYCFRTNELVKVEEFPEFILARSFNGFLASISDLDSEIKNDILENAIEQ